MLNPYEGPERRQYLRQQSDLPARIVIARDTLVFCQTRDMSEGGTCIRRPGRFRVDIGEQLVLAGGGMLGTGRDARVVHVSDCLLHCAFIE
jgi:hypothetical protein